MSALVARVLGGTALLASSAALAMSDEEHRMGGIPNMPAHILRTDGPQAGHDRTGAAFGRPRDPTKVSARIVAAMPDTRHEHDNVLTVDPGQTRSIVWEFGDTAEVELACHMHGHYGQGMLVRAAVRR